jgi:hypothetical protein
VSFDEKQKLAMENRKAALNAMSILGYLEQPDTPAACSPVGVLMSRTIAKNPGIGFEGARMEAHVTCFGKLREGNATRCRRF